MCQCCNRRAFLEGTAAGAASLGLFGAFAAQTMAANDLPATAASKVRIGKVYFGIKHPAWPKYEVDVEAERQRVEKEFARLQPKLADIERIDCGVVADQAGLEAAKEKLKTADGILLVQLTMGMQRTLKGLLETGLPVVWFAEPFCGHEWTTAPNYQRQGKRLDIWASGNYDDLVPAIAPLRAIRRLRDAKLLHVSTSPANADYVKGIKERFGTEIVSLSLDDLKAAYNAIDEKAAAADAQQWIAGAEKVIEPNKEDMLKAARMALAIEAMVRQHRAAAITINCLGMNILDHGMGYPCLGFCRLNDVGLGGICEADLLSSMTHLIFSYLTGRPGFVTDPCFDYSTNTILHAHCVSSTKMLGIDGPKHPYIIRSHLEDDKSAVLQVKLPVNQVVSMAKLVGNDKMLFSTGEAIDSPLIDRGCRTKLTVRVQNPRKYLEGWTAGLHRVIFYGDHGREIERFCRLTGVRLIREGSDEPDSTPTLPRPQHITPS